MNQTTLSRPFWIVCRSSAALKSEGFVWSTFAKGCRGCPIPAMLNFRRSSAALKPEGFVF